MQKFRTQVTILLLTALVLISILSILATVMVYRTNTIQPKFAYRIEPSAPDTSINHMSVVPASDDLHPDYMIVLSYAALIATSSAVVSIIVGNMLIRPLETLQVAIESVNPQAVIPKIAEPKDAAAAISVRLVNQLSERLRKALESRMRLVAAAGHDMRTPLTRMRLRAEMLDDETARKKWIDDIDEMMHIADSAITLVREEVSTAQGEPIRLDLLVEDIVAENDMIGLPVKIERLQEASIMAGPLAIKRAINNLLVNACIHGKNPSVSVFPEGDQAMCVIVDEGPGIPEDMIQNAFEPFFRVDSARRKSAPGAGLGLAIVKELITRYGGTITLANRKPSGLYQEVSLPLLTKVGGKAES